VPTVESGGAENLVREEELNFVLGVRCHHHGAPSRPVPECRALLHGEPVHRQVIRPEVDGPLEIEAKVALHFLGKAENEIEGNGIDARAPE
jgi:hypothetical protein